MHTLEPTGVFARNLAECLALQFSKRDRFDPAMEAMIVNLPALARRDFPLLRKVCGVDDEDLADMIAEIKRLEPKPGRAFGDAGRPPAIPDVYVVAAPDRTWRVELNSQALPRVLVNETYAATIRRGAARGGQAICLDSTPVGQLADQEPRTARPHDLNVATEIVRRQDAFLVEGVRAEALQPEDGRRSDRRSRIDRVARYGPQVHPDPAWPVRDEVLLYRGHSVRRLRRSPFRGGRRQRIRQMIDGRMRTTSCRTTSIVERLRRADILVARRTVAKYRDSLKIPSSVERRKLKLSPIGAPRARGKSVGVEA